MLTGFLLAQVAFASVEVQKGPPNPVANVVKLITRLETKIKKEGATEAAAYDKFACFCKEQADEKLFSITKKKGRIAELSAIIKKCKADIESFTSDMEAAKTRKAELETQNNDATASRKKQNGEFLAAKADRIQGINEVLEAIEEVKASAKAQAGFIQVSEGTKALLEEAGAADPGDAKAYAFKGGETIETLQKLHKEFKAMLKELMETEAENKHAHDMAEGARINEIMAKEALITKCQDVIGKRSGEKSDSEKEKKDQTEDKEEDEGYLKDVTEECEDKAVAWDRRSKRRVNELTAMAQALDILKGDATSKYGSNKLAFAQIKTQRHRRAVRAIMHHKGHWVWKQDAAPMSFIQIASEPSAAKKDASKTKIVSNLAKQASLLKSSTLEALVMALEDSPFDSVKKMIEDLIKKIDDEQSAEDDEIEDCKNDIKDNTKKRSKNAARMEEEEATIVEETSAEAIHEQDAKELGVEISGLYKDLNEATEIRAQEKKQNDAVLEDAKAGKASVDKAIKVLKEFYDSEALLQTKENPEIADGSDFLGDDPDGDVSKQDEAKGIFGLLGTISDDYGSTIEGTEKEETDAETDYNSFKTMTETDIDDKKTAKTDKGSKAKQSVADVEQAKIDLASWTTQKKEAEYELSILTPRCLGLGAQAAEQKKRREEEKKALQDAITILDTMGPAAAPEPSEEFLQIRKH
jgi:hypothetical protein